MLRGSPELCKREHQSLMSRCASLNFSQALAAQVNWLFKTCPLFPIIVGPPLPRARCDSDFEIETQSLGPLTTETTLCILGVPLPSTSVGDVFGLRPLLLEVSASRKHLINSR